MNPVLNIVIADDDEDDCFLFREAFESLNISAQLLFIPDGAKLMEQLPLIFPLPDMIFLDLNMPCKNGITCLIEIKDNPLLKQIPVIILSTSGEHVLVDKLYQKGAKLFICKPNDFRQLEILIKNAVKDVINKKSTCTE